MDKKTFYDLAIARIYRSGELLEEARDLLKRDRYKSANNRAFYSVEKLMSRRVITKKCVYVLIVICYNFTNGVLNRYSIIKIT